MTGIRQMRTEAAVAISRDDLEYLAASDADEDGRQESLMLVFPDSTLLCVSDNDGDGVADYAAVDIHLTKVVDLAVNRDGADVYLRADGWNSYNDALTPAELADEYPGWAALLDVRFPGGVPTEGTLDDVLAICNEQLIPDWTRRRIPWQEGGLYCTRDEDGGYGVLKVLALDKIGVHIRQYSNRYDARPEHLDEGELFLAPFDPDNETPGVRLGMGHLPLSAGTFRAWRPEFVQQSTVSSDELEGYRGWQEAEGGYF
jgi:hypothetical protein